MSPKPVVLVMRPHLTAAMRALETEFDVRHGWDGAEPEVLAETQAVVTAGEYVLDKDMLAAMPRLKLIACFTSGYDGIDVDWARARGLVVTHAPGVNHEDAADHAIGLILGHRRQIVAGDRTLRAGGWASSAKTMTRSLGGARLGLVGLGRIGEAVARRAEAMRMRVAWWGPNAKETPWPRAGSLLALARDSDILVVCAKAEASNRGLISREVMEALGPDGLLVNVARGQLVDEDALIAALKDGRLGGAALDVYAQEPTPAQRWDGVPNTVLTPHTAGATDAAVAEMVRLVVDNVRAVVIEGGAPVTPVP